VLLAWGLLLVTGGLAWMRMIGELALGAGAWVWVVALLAPGSRVRVVRALELRQDDPAVDIRVLRRPEMWPVQATAFLDRDQPARRAGAAVDVRRHRSLPRLRTWGWMPRALQHHRRLPRLLIVGAVLFAVTSRRASPVSC
jgi:hypothetical protein